MMKPLFVAALLFSSAAFGGSLVSFNVGDGAPSTIDGQVVVDPWKPDPSDPSYEYTDHFLDDPVDVGSTIVHLSRFSLGDWGTFKYQLYDDGANGAIRIWRFWGNDVGGLAFHLVQSDHPVHHVMLTIEPEYTGFQNFFIDSPVPFYDPSDALVITNVVGEVVRGISGAAKLEPMNLVRPSYTSSPKIWINGRVARTGVARIPVQVVDLSSVK